MCKLVSPREGGSLCIAARSGVSPAVLCLLAMEPRKGASSPSTSLSVDDVDEILGVKRAARVLGREPPQMQVEEKSAVPVKRLRMSEQAAAASSAPEEETFLAKLESASRWLVSMVELLEEVQRSQAVALSV